ncbi:MAG: hypothetical protein U1E92_06725 [Moraxella osloensis]
MVMGQMLDLNGEHQQLSQTELEAIHRDKTGALIERSIDGCHLCQRDWQRAASPQ